MQMERFAAKESYAAPGYRVIVYRVMVCRSLGSISSRMRSGSIGATIVSVAHSNKEGISVVLEPHPVVQNGGRGSRGVIYSGRSDRPVGFRLRPEFRCSPCLLRLTLSISSCSARRSATAVRAGRAVRPAIGGHRRSRADQLPRRFRRLGAGTELYLG